MESEDVNKLLDEVMAEFKGDPYKVWEYLEEDDLLVTRSKRNRFIICVRKYVPERRAISIKFIYSIRGDRFYEEDESGWETPELVERSPTTAEVSKLRENEKYQIYLSKQKK